MSSDLRYEDAAEKDYYLLSTVRLSFPDLEGANIKLLFDLKKKMSAEKIILAKIYKTNELIRHLTAEGLESYLGTDYIIFLDGACWNLVGDDDKIRILRHELRHGVYAGGRKFPYQLTGHDIEDFEAEVRLNQDDIGWRKRVAELTLEFYHLQEETAKQAKKEARKRKGKKSQLAEVFEEKKVEESEKVSDDVEEAR